MIRSIQNLVMGGNIPTVSPESPQEYEGIVSRWKESLEPWIREVSQDGYFIAKDGVKINFRKVINEKEKGKVLLLTGWSESLLKYTELIREIYDEGYSIYVMDFRGQGLSERETPLQHISFVKNFQDYVWDTHSFINQYMTQDNPKEQISIVAHSMGAAVSVLLAASFPEKIRCMALSAPMLRINVTEAFESVADKITRSLLFLGKGEKLMLGQRKNKNEIDFPDNVVTHSKARFDVWMKTLEDNPKIRIDGASSAWVAAAIQATRDFPQVKSKLKTPTLILQAEEDRVVNNKAQDRFVENNSLVKKIVVKKAFHELFMEEEEKRKIAVKETLKFLDAYLA